VRIVLGHFRGRVQRRQLLHWQRRRRRTRGAEAAAVRPIARRTRGGLSCRRLRPAAVLPLTQRTQGGLAQRWSSLLALRLAWWRWGSLGRRHTSSLACAYRAALAWCPLEERRWDRSSSLLEPPQQGKRRFPARAAGDGGAALVQA
jgi:hypothetical protein